MKKLIIVLVAALVLPMMASAEVTQIDSMDSLSGWIVDSPGADPARGGMILALDTTDFTEGTGSLKALTSLYGYGTHVDWNSNHKKLYPAFDLTYDTGSFDDTLITLDFKSGDKVAMTKIGLRQADGNVWAYAAIVDPQDGNWNTITLSLNDTVWYSDIGMKVPVAVDFTWDSVGMVKICANSFGHMDSGQDVYFDNLAFETVKSPFVQIGSMDNVEIGTTWLPEGPGAEVMVPLQVTAGDPCESAMPNFIEGTGSLKFATSLWTDGLSWQTRAYRNLPNIDMAYDPELHGDTHITLSVRSSNGAFLEKLNFKNSDGEFAFAPLSDPANGQWNTITLSTNSSVFYSDIGLTTPIESFDWSDITDRKSTRLNSSHLCASRMPSSA